MDSAMLYTNIGTMAVVNACCACVVELDEVAAADDEIVRLWFAPLGSGRANIDEARNATVASWRTDQLRAMI